ncbi:MAG: cysteine--tRNA ligase, partial [Candidatus Wildermuthbacteria bacterium]|nr:cysteine--tRNA ligase [Candidatus Wildermuthbacteria bacterium]
MLKVYNTLSRKKEIFKPLSKARGKKVNLFTCGPTVYDFSHLGHARTYIAFDMIVKYLRQKGYNVFYLQNITDLDDKIIKRAAERNITPQKLAEDFEKEYIKDVKALKITSVSKYARATDYIKEIISQTERLLKKDFAYQIEDGIYFDISKFKDYGKLSRRTIIGAENAISRIDESVGKKNKGDFCLWKFAKAGSDPTWPSPFGSGRPGWHIEDTAITEKFFGPQYDIHGGARDLIFPHHEAEISQMEAISGKKPLVKYWLHTGFLTVEGQKMSKSLGNFITIQDFLKNQSARLLRFLVIKSHYRSPIDYNEKIISQTKAELEKIDEFLEKLSLQKNHDRGNSVLIENFKKKSGVAMDDDFNTPRAVAVIFDLINKGNALIAQNKLSAKDAKNILIFLKEIDQFFNFIFWPKIKEAVPQKLLNLVKQRQECRE